MFREMRMLEDIKKNGLDIEEDLEDETDPTSEFDLGDELK